MQFPPGGVKGAPPPSYLADSSWAAAHKIIKMCPRGAWQGSGLLLLGPVARGPLSDGSGQTPWSLKLFGQEQGYKREQPASCPLAAWASCCCPTAKTEKGSQFQGLHFSQALVPQSHILELTQRKTSLTLLPGAPRVKLHNKLPFPAEKVQPTGKWMLLSFKTILGGLFFFFFFGQPDFWQDTEAQ